MIRGSVSRATGPAALRRPVAVASTLLIGLAAAVAAAPPVAGAAPGDGATGLATGSLGSLAVASGSASSDAHAAAPYIAGVHRIRQGGQSALRVTLTEAGRTSWGPVDEAAAWAEVVALSPDAATPGMRQQFTCHWIFARVAEPGRRVWSLEPWRPVVADAVMIATGCNPEGGLFPGSGG